VEGEYEKGAKAVEGALETVVCLASYRHDDWLGCVGDGVCLAKERREAKGTSLV